MLFTCTCWQNKETGHSLFVHPHHWGLAKALLWKSQLLEVHTLGS
jgi:hypothetical protein